MTTVVFSLDTELAWGRPSNDTRKALFDDPTAGREAIAFVLNVLAEYDIPATWAIVGHLLLESCEESSHITPSYVEELDPYTSVSSDPLYYYPELLDHINSRDQDHEIAGHAFAHPRFGDLIEDEARAELGAMTEVFAERGFPISTMVHPGTDLSYLELLPEFGITAYSGGCPVSNETIKSGIPKLLCWDSELVSAPLRQRRTDEFGTSVLPRSLLLRDERWGWLNPRRVRSALSNASSDDERILHLTFHPHNIIYDPFLQWSLPQVLKVIDRKRSEGSVTVKTLGCIE